MLKNTIILSLTILLLPEAAIAQCDSVTELPHGYHYWMEAHREDGFCIKKWVSADQLPVVTLKWQEGGADFDVRVYSDPGFGNLVAQGLSLGPQSEHLVLPRLERSGYVYIYVNNCSPSYGKYNLYIDQIDFWETAIEAFAQTGAEWALTELIREMFDINVNSDSHYAEGAERASVAIISSLRGRNLAGVGEDVLINELRREYVGNNFLASFAVNLATRLVGRVYARF